MMTSKSHLSSSSRYPLKRVRQDNENHRSLISSNEHKKKKFSRETSEDSAFVETEKSSDERAFDLFQKEYFHQFRPYFHHRSIVRQLIEHLWANMNDSSKVSFIKKCLKDQANSHLESFSNDENDIDSNRSPSNVSHGNISNPTTNNKYSRTFLNEFLIYLKHWITPRSNDQNLGSKSKIPLRRSSRVRRAPMKCVCSSCINTRHSHQDPSSLILNQTQDKQFRQLIDHYLQLDDQFVDQSNISSNTVNETTNLSDIAETTTDDNSLLLSPIGPLMATENLENCFSPSIDFLLDSSTMSNDKIPLVTSDSLLTEATTMPMPPLRRTFVILTELDEPFFGPYPIEFTITI